MQKFLVAFVALAIVLGFVPTVAHAQIPPVSLALQEKDRVNGVTSTLTVDVTVSGQPSLRWTGGTLFLAMDDALEAHASVKAHGLSGEPSKESKRDSKINWPFHAPSATHGYADGQWWSKTGPLGSAKQMPGAIFSFEGKGLPVGHTARSLQLVIPIPIKGSMIKANMGAGTAAIVLVNAIGFTFNTPYDLLEFQRECNAVVNVTGIVPLTVTKGDALRLIQPEQVQQPITSAQAEEVPATTQVLDGAVIDGKVLTEAMNRSWSVTGRMTSRGYLIEVLGQAPSDLALSVTYKGGQREGARFTDPNGVLVSQPTEVAEYRITWEGKSEVLKPDTTVGGYNTKGMLPNGNQLLAGPMEPPVTIRPVRAGLKTATDVRLNAQRWKQLEDLARKGLITRISLTSDQLISMSVSGRGGPNDRREDRVAKKGHLVYGHLVGQRLELTPDGGILPRQWWDVDKNSICDNFVDAFVETTGPVFYPQRGEVAGTFLFRVDETREVVTQHQTRQQVMVSTIGLPAFVGAPLVSLVRSGVPTSTGSSYQMSFMFIWSRDRKCFEPVTCDPNGVPGLLNPVPGTIPNAFGGPRPDQGIGGAP